MIIAYKSEDIPKEVYEEVNKVHISSIPVKEAKTLDDIILYAKVWSFNHSKSGLYGITQIETDSFRISAYEEPKMHVKIEFLCIEEVSEIDNEIERLRRKREDIIKKNRDVFREMTLENLGI